MKTMKRHLFQSITALCLIAAFSLASCNRIEDIPGEDPEIQQPAANEISFSATLAPKGEEPQSKAITSGTEAGKEVLNVAWAEYEHIAIYYQKTDDSWATAMATVGTPNPDGSAPITATLTNAKGGTANFVYPYSLAKNGELKTGAGSAFRSQDGTLEYISQNLDAATATGTIDVTGGTATVSGTVAMQNQVCFCKFNFSGLSGDVTENYYDITIREKAGGSTVHTYTTSSIAKASMGAVYMALLGAAGKDFTFSVQGFNKSSATDPSGMSKNYYETSSTGVTLTAGKFYRSIPVAVDDILWTDLEPITGDQSTTVTIPTGSRLTLDSATISVTDGGPAIVCEGDATIILTGTNTVTTSAADKAVIQAGPAGSTLTILGTGSLTATGSSIASQRGAGIGSNVSGTCGNIVINGGTITASGYSDNNPRAAGIGSGTLGTCGDITINGGTVTATAGGRAAAIGAGYCGHCGNVTIGSGVTSVTANKSASSPYSIGLGDSSLFVTSTCGTITIGGTVYYDGSVFMNNGQTYLTQNPLVYPEP